VIYHSAVIAQGDAILTKDLPEEIRAAVAAPGAPETGAAVEPGAAVAATAASAEPWPAAELSVNDALDLLLAKLGGGEEPVLARIERELVARAMAAEGGDEAKAAKRLGLTRAALQKRAREI
jgi:DNA-binding NtrC family response regulator